MMFVEISTRLLYTIFRKNATVFHNHLDPPKRPHRRCVPEWIGKLSESFPKRPQALSQIIAAGKNHLRH